MRSTQRRQEVRTAFLFILPAFVGYLLFTIGPTLYAVVMSFTEYSPLKSPTFIGLDNYERLLTDSRLHQVARNTAIYVVAVVILMNVIGLALAVLLNSGLPAVLRNVLRAAYFFPSLVGLVYVSIIWQFLLHRDLGIVNYYLTTLGLPRLNWLGDASMAIVSVLLIDIWRNVGLTMLIYLAALQDVPTDLKEAARVDGASELQVLRKIVVPLIGPAIFFCISMNMIGSFQIFESIVVLTDGGPGDSSRSVVLYLWEKGFQSFEMGYASAIALTLATVIMLFTVLHFTFRRVWVHYE